MKDISYYMFFLIDFVYYKNNTAFLPHVVIHCSIETFSSDSRPFRLGGGANMERVVRMDREMTKV